MKRRTKAEKLGRVAGGCLFLGAVLGIASAHPQTRGMEHKVAFGGMLFFACSGAGLLLLKVREEGRE